MIFIIFDDKILHEDNDATKFILVLINRPVGGALRLAWYRGNAPTTGRFLALAQSLDIATW